jgi:hypothetical protein
MTLIVSGNVRYSQLSHLTVAGMTEATTTPHTNSFIYHTGVTNETALCNGQKHGSSLL